MWKDGGKSVHKTHDAVDATSMFGDFEINVNSSAKAGTELGFEFKALLDNDYSNFSADDFDIEINANSIALSGINQCSECNENISNPSDGVTAFGRVYHRNHVKCAATGKDFVGGGEAYEGEDGKIYCQEAWEKKYQKTCSICSKPIKAKKPVSYIGGTGGTSNGI